MEAYQHFESKLVGRKSRPGATIPPLSTATRTNELILLNKRPEIDDSEMSDDPDGTSSDEISGKDETEQKLETLVFGDQAGFHDALKSYDQKLGSYSATSNAVDFDDEGSDSTQLTNTFADVDDADLFFLDSGTNTTSNELLDLSQSIVREKGYDGSNYSASSAAWEDSDDDRISVSLAANPRLRKLRVSEGENIVDGSEYVKRLRLQFARLHPPPDWVRHSPPHSSGPEANKRRKRASQGAVMSDVEESGIDEERDTDDEELWTPPPLGKILQNTADLTIENENITTERRGLLRQGVLDIQRLKDVGGNQPSSIDSLSFHLSYPLLLSSGPSSSLYLHHVSPQSSFPNPLLTSLHVRRTPIRTSAFSSPTGNRILFSGRRRYFHAWDLDTGNVTKVNGSTGRKEEQRSMELFKPSPCGRWIGLVGSSRKGGGLINIVNAVTGQWITQVRVDSRGGVADFAWWSDGEGMSVVGKSGEVSEWDGRLNRVVARWTDQGAVGTTVLCLGGQLGATPLGGDRWIAIGSSSGVVNLYDRRAWAPSTRHGDGRQLTLAVPPSPKPVRVLDQLTTPISHITFSSDGQLLAMASRWKKDSLRLVHLPSCTVYQNWPTSNTPLGRISAVAISPKSDMLAVANEQGKIRLWQIHD